MAIEKSVSIDVLSINTEGYDFTVLKSGREAIQQASSLGFEFHEVGNWSNQYLADAIKYLDVSLLQYLYLL